MNGTRRHPIWTWVIHTPWVLAVLAILGVIIFFVSGAGNPLIQRLLIARLERATGGKVEFRAMSIRWLAMRVTLNHLVIHGNEPAGVEPLFTADEVQAALRIDSFWGQRVSLNELLVQQPNIHIIVGKNGGTNVPSPRRRPALLAGCRRHRGAPAVSRYSGMGDCRIQFQALHAASRGRYGEILALAQWFCARAGGLYGRPFPRRCPSGDERLRRPEMDIPLPRMGGTR